MIEDDDGPSGYGEDERGNPHEPTVSGARLRDEWHEDMGPQLWWDFPIVEPPYCGSPLYDDWPGYHGWFTPIPVLVP